MVQSLNWNNYSPAQILELKNKGVEVPEDIYKKAEASLSETDAKEVTEQSNDNKQVQYGIVDTAGEKNEAKELRAQLEAEGASLKDIVSQFTTKSTEAAEQMSAAMKEVGGFVSYITVNETEAQALTDAANDETAVVIEIVEETQEKIEKKADELDFLNEKIEEGTATEDEQAQAETVSKEIGDISNKTADAIKGKVSTADVFNSQAATINENLKDVANKTGKALNGAKDAIELADETQDVSKKLYDKGIKIRTIAMAIGGVLGGVGGFLAGKAISNKMNDRAINNFASNNKYTPAPQKAAAWEQTTNKMLANSIVGKAGGALAGAGLGVALGSLFGGESIEMGENGMAAASNLKDVSNQTKALSEKVAEQNNISIATAQTADVSVSDFDAAVSDGTDKAGENIKNNQVAENPEAADAEVKPEEDDPTKKKQTV